ncbi:BcNRPS1, nonribosomal peptide synthetase [Xylaria sp. FL1777]|nr:BcNRPS1, nonribosomal peptide synthetase [Xylaria sp. FL1777]
MNNPVSDSLPGDMLLKIIEIELRIPAQQLDLDSSFVRNGGDSLSALRVVSSCRSKGIAVTVAMIMSYESMRHLMHDLQHQCRNDTFSHFISQETTLSDSDNKASSIIQPEPKISSHHPRATRMQLSLIHGSRAVSGSNIIRYSEVYHTAYIPEVKYAWQILFSMEPIFRTKFEIINNEYHLVENTEASFVWEEIIVNDRRTYLSTQRVYDSSCGFLGSTFKVVHLKSKMEKSESTVIWNIHHALIDGYSSVLLLNKHRALLAGHSISAGPSFGKFIDHISEIHNLSTSKLVSQSFWAAQRATLKSSRAELNLPRSAFPYNPIYARSYVRLGVAWDTLHRHSKTHGVTMASLFYAAWALTLGRYIDSDDIYFGVVLSGRSVPVTGADAVIGPLINTVPFQVSLKANQKLPNFLMSIFKHAIQLEEYQWVMPQDDITGGFPSILNIHFEEPLLKDNPLGLLRGSEATLISESPLSVEIHLREDVCILFHEHVYCNWDIEGLARCFSEAITALVHSDGTVKEIGDTLLSGDVERLWDYGNCRTGYAESNSCTEDLVSLFDKTAAEIPEYVALEKGNETITYAQLHIRTTAIARKLSHHIRPGDVVCVHADRTLNWIVAIYGVLKARGVYCPLDADLPGKVRNQNFSDSGSRIFLVGHDANKIHQPTHCQSCLSVEEMLREQDEHSGVSQSAPESRGASATPEPCESAYLCYTSGSTGKPKGVLCTHRGLLAFQKDFNVRLQSRPRWRIAQIMSPAFDGSIHEIFSALCYGSTLVLRSLLEPLEHLSTVDAAILTPSIASLLKPEDFPSLKVLYLVGEAVSPSVRDKWASVVTSFNMYGPTEATCGVTIKELKTLLPVTLGKPVSSARIYVLDHQRRLAPLGVVGEIYLGGIQISQGYVNQPEETARRFLPDCVLPETGNRMYRTGDRGYWDEKGELRFCGRNDRQIKLRGFRVDLDDVEVRIHNAISGCTGVAVTYNDGDLVAQLKPSNLDVSQVRKQLSETLPGYSVPRRIATVSEFPHTNAGKVDYKAVKASAIVESTDHDVGLMDTVSAAWKDVLQQPNITLNASSNFIESGGHSLLQLQLANKLSTLLGYAIPLGLIIQASTLGDLVERITKTIPVDQANFSPEIENSQASINEESWWRRYNFSGGSASFNVTLCFKLGSEVNVESLATSWNIILRRHLNLRCHFLLTAEGFVQKQFFENPPEVKMAKSTDIYTDINTPFDLERDYLIRVTLTPDTLLLVASHIICDYTAFRTMLYEAGCAYHGVSLGEPSRIKGKVTSQPTPNDIQFWKTYLRNSTNQTYSVGGLSKTRRSYSGSSHLCHVKKSTFLRLGHFISSQRLTAHHVSLAAVAVALQHHYTQIDVTLGAPYLGRGHSSTYDTVGLFLEPLPIRVRYSPDEEPISPRPNSEFLAEVRKSSQRALSHAISWHEILKATDMTDDLPDNHLFDVMVSYHEAFGKLRMPDVDAELLYTWTEGAKFKLMVEFITADDTGLIVRLEYSEECFTTDEIKLLGKMFVSAFEMLVDSMPLAAIKETLSRSSVNPGRKLPPFGVLCNS